MSFLSLHFAAMVAVLFVVYYILPKRFQPLLLLVGSLYFYYCCSGPLLLVLVGTSLIAFLLGLWIPKHKKLCFFAVLLLLSPLVAFKFDFISIGIPLGISFYTLQLIAYCVDLYRGKYKPETNFLHFLLFTSFFPQILQGPIPRYESLKETLFAPHDLEEQTMTEGLFKILGGLFLKLMIADKAAIFVNSVFNSDERFAGAFYLAAGILYSFQLYADFLSCVLLAQGVALLFGVKLSENFAQPYLATSIKDFWRRWHISLSSWLREYVYIPLGGNRKGKLRTNLHLLITFFVSGLWHGTGFKYVAWGLLHGMYQIIGKYTLSFRDRFFSACKIPERWRLCMQRVSTFILAMFAWILFRANSLRDGLTAWYSIAFDFQLKTFADTVFTFGLSLPEILVLLLSIAALCLCDHQAEKGKIFSKVWLDKPPVTKFLCAFLVLLVVAIFGTYGFGYDANAFIYGGF